MSAIEFETAWLVENSVSHTCLKLFLLGMVDKDLSKFAFVVAAVTVVVVVVVVVIAGGGGGGGGSGGVAVSGVAVGGVVTIAVATGNEDK